METLPSIAYSRSLYPGCRNHKTSANLWSQSNFPNQIHLVALDLCLVHRTKAGLTLELIEAALHVSDRGPVGQEEEVEAVSEVEGLTCWARPSHRTHSSPGSTNKQSTGQTRDDTHKQTYLASPQLVLLVT